MPSKVQILLGPRKETRPAYAGLVLFLGGAENGVFWEDPRTYSEHKLKDVNVLPLAELSSDLTFDSHRREPD